MARQPSQTNMIFARRVAPAGMAPVGWSPLPSDRVAIGEFAHIAGTVFILTAAACGMPLDGPIVSILACMALLLFGLPHGTFDLALIRQVHAEQHGLHAAILYIGLAAAMFALWMIIPALAFTVFFGLAIVHFGEDWSDHLPSLLAHGTSVALLTAPTFLHHEALTGVFALLIGDAASGLVVAAAVLVAPVSIATAAVAVIALWHDQHRILAIRTGAAITAMVFLPPVTGFALYFCLMHSPTQFAAARHTLNWHRFRQWAPVSLPLTLSALGLAALIYVTLSPVAITGATVITAFMTLSILTLPHMAVPIIAARLGDYRPRSV